MCFQWTLTWDLWCGQIKHERVWLFLKSTSFGFSDIGFSPWASRTWPWMKGEKTCKRSRVIKKQTCFATGPCNLLLLQAKGTFPAALSSWSSYRKGVSERSYIFGVGPSALWWPHFTLSHQPQGQVREGRQVSTGTYCPFLWDEGEARSWKKKVMNTWRWTIFILRICRGCHCHRFLIRSGGEKLQFYHWRLGSWHEEFPKIFHCALWPEYWSWERAACESSPDSAGSQHLNPMRYY